MGYRYSHEVRQHFDRSDRTHYQHQPCTDNILICAEVSAHSDVQSIVMRLTLATCRRYATWEIYPISASMGGLNGTVR